MRKVINLDLGSLNELNHPIGFMRPGNFRLLDINIISQLDPITQSRLPFKIRVSIEVDIPEDLNKPKSSVRFICLLEDTLIPQGMEYFKTIYLDPWTIHIYFIHESHEQTMER